MKNPELAERMHFLKETGEGRRLLFGIEKEIFDDGRAKEKIEISLNLIRMKLPLEEVNKATGLAMDELRKLKKKAELQPS